MKKHSISIPTAIMLCLLAAVVTFNIMFFVMTDMYNDRLGNLEQTEARYQKLKSVADIVNKYYIAEYDEADAIEGALSGYVAGLGDKWSAYYTAEQSKQIEESESNSYVGIGLSYSTEPESLYAVLSVTADSPAAKAGILVGDVIAAIDGKSVSELESPDQLTSWVQGEKGTSVSVTVTRAGEQKNFTIQRDTVHTQNVTSELMENGIGRITILDFNTGVEEEFSNHLDALLEQGAKGLIFDVRNNPGGFLTVLRTVLDRLLPEGIVITTVDHQGNETPYTSDADCVEMPMAVITNRYSISAAEFFAAALQEYGVADVVGEATSGKGYSQQSFKLSDGSTVHISTTRYYTPKGQSLADTGVTPDHPVELTEDQFQALLSGDLPLEEDAQLQQAFNLVSARVAALEAETQPAPDAE